MANIPDPDVLLSRLREHMKKDAPKDDGNTQSEESVEPDKKVLFSDEVKRLRACHKLLDRTTKFAVGDVIVWKPGLKNLSQPGYDRPALVMEVLEKPIIAGSHDMQTNEYSSHYLEPLSLKVLVAVDDRTVVEYYVDGRRFEKAPKNR